MIERNELPRRPCPTVWLRLCWAAVLVLAANSSSALAQTGLRESLERLDRDRDGDVEPEEITDLARPFLERIAAERGMSINGDVDIDDLMEAARRYQFRQSPNSDRPIRELSQSTVKPFGPDQEQSLVPEFGLPSMKYPYTQDDLDFADRTLGTHDRNDDGFIDRIEAQRERWTHRDPFDDDINRDDRLSRLELAQRYARRRLLETFAQQQPSPSRRPETSSEYSRERSGREESSWWRRGGSSYWLSASVLERFDANQNGRLEVHETQTLGLPAGEIDINRDGELSRDELFAYLSPLQEEAGQLSEGIPGWFFELDLNRDRQVSMAEFASEWTSEKMSEFESLDINLDGLLTIPEVAQSKAMMGGSYANREAQLLPPGKTVISEIEVADDVIIADLNVQLSITHTHVAHLDGFLTGPDGQRIELFTEVGAHEDNFEDTIFDDQAGLPIVKAQAPFTGSFLPEAVVKREPSLSHFQGKNAKGIWQLVIRGTRSERFGMLHGWSLNIRLEEQRPGESAVTAAEPAPPAAPATPSP